MEPKRPIDCQNLIEFFNERIKTVRNFDQICFKIIGKHGEESLSFGRLHRGAKEFAHYLMKYRGVVVGDRVAVLSRNQANWDIVFWGIILAGAVPVLIDPERRVEGVKRHLVQTRSKLLVLDDNYQRIDNIVTFIPSVRINVLFTIRLKTFSNEIQKQVKREDTAVIICTSGTTDNPKEVELTHFNLLANVQGSLEAVSFRKRDRIGHILPPYHSFGLTVGKFVSFYTGALSIYTDKYSQIGQFIKEEKISIFIGVPALFQVMAKRFERINSFQKIGLRFVWRRLRFCLSGSAPLSLRALNIFWKTGIRLYEGYGTTENSPVYGFNNNPKKLGSVGKPISTILVKIADGEILLGGPCIMKGYYNNPLATAEAIEYDKDGIRWLHTGDLGHLDNDGYLYIVGRKKSIIVLPSGKKVSPESVEKVLCSAKYVKEVLVIYLGKGLKALVVPDTEELGSDSHRADELILASIKEYQNEKLSPFERVSVVELVAELPKTSIGKIRRDFYINKTGAKS